jgi:hypothetical protein
MIFLKPSKELIHFMGNTQWTNKTLVNQSIEFSVFNSFHKNFPSWLGFHLGELSLRKTLNMFREHNKKKKT